MVVYSHQCEAFMATQPRKLRKFSKDESYQSKHSHSN